MPNSPRMGWPYPAEDQDPWFDTFQTMVSEMDASGYASREDRQLVMGKGGTWTFTSGVLTWTAALEIYSPIAGPKLSLPAGNATLQDGQALYVVLTRSPRDNVTLTAVVSNQVPSTNDAYVLCVRSGDAVYFRHGLVLANGVSAELFAPSTTGTTLIWAGGRETHNSSYTPLVCGAFAFTPTDYGSPDVITFRAVAANGDTGLTNYVRLYNVTDNEQVAQLEFTSTDIAKDEAILVQGTGTGEIDTPEHIYEVHILLGAPSTGPNDTIELYSAELRLT